MLDYAIITPARDEEAFLPRLADNVVAQAVLPKEWVIVDDGSIDRTMEIAQLLASEHTWIRCKSIRGPERPTRGGPVVEAFECGVDELSEPPAIIVKLDADVEIPPNYFERVIRAFEENPSLGLACGTRLELDGDDWKVRRVTGKIVRAQARAYRDRCLIGIRPLERCVGWDHIDVMKAAARGWSSMEIGDLYVRHLRAAGARDGDQYWSLQGAAAHYLGYRPSYVLFRALHRFPNDRKSLRMITSYFSGVLHKRQRCPDPWVVAKTREHQRLSNLPKRVRELRSSRPTEPI